MKLHPEITAEEIDALLRDDAVRVYGDERARALADQIRHLSKMMETIARRDLDLTDAAPATSDTRDRDR